MPRVSLYSIKRSCGDVADASLLYIVFFFCSGAVILRWVLVQIAEPVLGFAEIVEGLPFNPFLHKAPYISGCNPTKDAAGAGLTCERPDFHGGSQGTWRVRLGFRV